MPGRFRAWKDFPRTHAVVRLSAALPHARGRGALRCLLACAMVLACGAAQAVDWKAPLKLFGGNEELVVWQAPGMYVKIVDQDRFKRYKRPPQNNHPANVGAADVATVLASLKIGKGGAAIFSAGAIAQVAPRIAEALGRVKPRQDVIFAVSDMQGKAGAVATAARVFVEEGHMNIILGDTLRPGGGPAQVIDHEESPWRPGRRRESMDTAQDMGAGPGISFRPGARTDRNDWAIIDVRAAVAGYHGPQIPMATMAEATAPDAAGGETNAQLLQERQQMRLEMARMRKQMEAQQGGTPAPAPTAAAPAPVAAPPASTAQGTPGATAPVAPVHTPQPAPQPDTRADAPAAAAGGTLQSLEQRLSTLQSLHDKKLITDAEYAAKRKQILDEL